MKKYIYLSILILSNLLFTSCQKVITLNLKDSGEKIVIEGEVNKGDSIHTVYITKSVNFSELNEFPKVSGASVVISDNHGNSETLIETSPGKYQTQNLIGIEGRTYTLTVVVDGKSYVASSTIPQQVTLDDLFFIKDGFGGGNGKIVIPIRQDPAGVQNNYKFDMWVYRLEKNKGWEKDSAIIIQDDQFSDGVITQQPVFGNIGAYKPGDSCRTTMSCIDRNVYTYFYSLSQNGPGGAATPANPVSNFSGGALGYFSGQSKQTLTVIVPE